MQVEDVRSGMLNPSRVLTRIAGLLREPWSQFAERFYADNPQETVATGNNIPSRYGWTPETTRLTMLINRVTVALAGKKVKAEHLEKFPWDTPKSAQPRTIAEFNTTQFKAQL